MFVNLHGKGNPLKKWRETLPDFYSVFCVSECSDELTSPKEELHDLSALNTTNQMVKDDEEVNNDKTQQQTTSPIMPYPANRAKIHSRKFRE